MLFLLFVVDNADEDDYEADEISDDALDDDDLYEPSLGPRRKSRSNRHLSTARSRRIQSKLSGDDDALPANELQSESGSDGDWREEGRRTGRRRRRKASRSVPFKRQRVSDPDDDDAARSARVYSRGGPVNYAELDDADFLESDQDAAAYNNTEYAEDPCVPYVERVVDYRRLNELSPVPNDAPPYSDFSVSDVEFKVKWTNLSFRKCSWETWENLRNLKGAKKVSNYIKEVERARESFLREGVTPEDLEEGRVHREEIRATLRSHENVDRVIAKRDSVNGEAEPEYLVKWSNLMYKESTWERRSDLTAPEDIKAIDDFTDRESSVWNNGSKKKFNPFNTKDDRPKFKRMSQQPDYLHGEGRTLRDYQLAGLNYLAYSWSLRNNVILADEMGLGKTVQTISFLGWLMYVRSIPGQFLVVVPLSTIAAWVREFARWVPDMNVVCYTGDAKSREFIRKYELYSSEKKVEKFHVLLTTPELVMQDEEFITDIRWSMIAVDEAHRLKNETSSLHKTLASFRSANRLLITGTPLQNSVRELWALLHFLNPDVFTDPDEFESSFSFTALRDPERVSALHKTLRPYIIRRQKGDVEKSLPKKSYSVLRVGMTSSQQQYYRWLLTRNFAKLNAGAKGRGMGPAQNIRNLLMELKKCCNHPFLFPNYEDTSTTTTVNDLVRPSGKMILLDKLLLRLREKGHRVLIFSQMVRMLDILQDYCRMRQFPCQRLDGSVENEVRQRAVDHFNAPDSTDFIFLLSTRAGGLGINLATADTVIIFDSDWNPQNDLQAESRAHRIGQKKDVKVFRLLTADTIEEDILERAKRKRVLEHVVIHGVEGGHKAEGKEKEVAFKKEELSAILRFGAEKLFAKDRVNGSLDEKSQTVDDNKVSANGTASHNGDDSFSAVKTKADEDADKDAKCEEKRALAIDDIDEILERAPDDEASQLGAAQPSIGDSLLNAFKWADFKTVEEDEGLDEKVQNNEMEMAERAANRMFEIGKEAEKAQKVEEREKNMLEKEGDSEFWDRVIPDHLREDAIASDVVLGRRRRKRSNMYGADPDEADSKRRRVTRGGQHFNEKSDDDDDLTAKEQRALLRSLKRFGDPKLIGTILKDAGLENRISKDVAMGLLNDCLEQARRALEQDQLERGGRKDSTHGSHGRGVKELKSKQPKVLVDLLGETGIDASELLKRCDDLKMLRQHVASFDQDIQFRLKNSVKLPAYSNVRWKSSHDAMLLVGVYRHGLGNWLNIAQDTSLGLGDKIGVSGNKQSKPGAPDSTKLMRRIFTLLRELEKELQSAHRNPSRGMPNSNSDVLLIPNNSAKQSKSRSTKKKNRRGSLSEEVSRGSNDLKRKRLDLRDSHKKSLRELRLLSRSDSDVDPREKIVRTKKCLLKLGRGIDEHAGSSEEIESNLWKYVHDVCMTSLQGDRLQGIYKRIVRVEAAETKGGD